MSFEHRYYADWTNPITGVRFRLVYMPRAVMRKPYGGAWTGNDIPWEDVPEFGADPAPGALWLRIPDGTIYNVQMPETGFDELPVGLPNPPSLSFAIRSGRLAGTDAEDLPTRMVSPAYDVAQLELVSDPTLAVDPLGLSVPAIEIEPGLWRHINTTNVGWLLTDDGVSTALIGGFRTAFIGGHERSLSQKHTVDEITGELVIELQLVHLWWLVTAQVLSSDIATRMRVAVAPETTLHLWDTVWWGTAGYARVLGTDSSGTDDDEHHMYSLAALWARMIDLATSVYIAFVRTSEGFIELADARGTYHNLALREQSQTVANTAGAINPDPWFCGFVVGADSGDDRGGFLSTIGEPKGTLHEWETMDLLLMDAVEGCAQKGAVRLTAPLEISIEDWGITDGFAELLITADQRWKGRTLEIGSAVLSGADAEIPGQEGDVEGIEYRLANVREHNNRTVPVVFNNAPHIGPIRNVWSGQFTRGGEVWQAVGSSLVTMNTLYYQGELVADGVGVGETVFIRYHHKVGVGDGATIYDECTDGIALPDPGTLGAGAWEDNLWYPWRLAAIAMQQGGCIPYATCARITNRFGDRYQTIIPGRYPAALAGVDQLGRRAGAAWASGASLTGLSMHGAVPGRPLLLSTGYDDSTGMAPVKLIALGGS